eukprot:s857_g31.t1
MGKVSKRSGASLPQPLHQGGVSLRQEWFAPYRARSNSLKQRAPWLPFGCCTRSQHCSGQNGSTLGEQPQKNGW